MADLLMVPLKIALVILKARGDLGFTAALVILASAGAILFMPFTVPLMVEGLTVSAWAIARPLLAVVLLPMAIGMLILRASPALATKCLKESS